MNMVLVHKETVVISVLYVWSSILNNALLFYIVFFSKDCYLDPSKPNDYEEFMKNMSQRIQYVKDEEMKKKKLELEKIQQEENRHKRDEEADHEREIEKLQMDVQQQNQEEKSSNLFFFSFLLVKDFV